MNGAGQGGQRGSSSGRCRRSRARRERALGLAARVGDAGRSDRILLALLEPRHRFMTTRLFRAAAACALLAGCATVTTLTVGHSAAGLADDMPCIPRVYSGVAGDVALLRGDNSEKELLVFDLPFSF